MSLEVEILTPNRLLVKAQIDELNVPSSIGYVGILPGHTAFLTILGQGVLMYRQGDQRNYIALFGGYMKVQNDELTAPRPRRTGIPEDSKVRRRFVSLPARQREYS